jgi:hypothetical protein
MHAQVMTVGELQICVAHQITPADGVRARLTVPPDPLVSEVGADEARCAIAGEIEGSDGEEQRLVQTCAS